MRSKLGTILFPINQTEFEKVLVEYSKEHDFVCTKYLLAYLLEMGYWGFESKRGIKELTKNAVGRAMSNCLSFAKDRKGVYVKI